MADVFIAKKGQLTQPSKVALRKAGIIVVEVEDPSLCSFVRASETISGDDMLWAAMNALKLEGGYGNKGEEQRQKLAKNLIEIVEQNRPTEARKKGNA